MNEGNVEAVCWTVFGLGFFAIIFGTMIVMSENKLRDEKAKIDAGLQQCQVLGSGEVIWQRECVTQAQEIQE